MATLQLTFASSFLAILSGCVGSTPSRHPIPPELIETAEIPGYENVRVWGDELSPAFAKAVYAKDQEVRVAAEAGRMADSVNKADFLAISGAGDQGAFAAGVLEGWTQRGDRPNFEVVTGVSAGALAAPFAFLGRDYDRSFRDVFTSMSAGDLFKSRGVFGYFKDALEDTTKLRATIEGFATDEFLDKIAAGNRDGRRILILTTNLDAERPMIWDLTAIAGSKRADRREIFVKVLLASSALPGIFPPVYFPVVASDGRHYDEMHVDGGATAQLVFVPPESNFQQTEIKIFGKLRQRSLWVIRSGKIVPEYAVSTPRAVDIASRAVATLVKYQVIADIARLDHFARDNATAFHFCAIPMTFEARTTRQFDPVYAAKLYDVGVNVGKQGQWSSMPPISPERFMQ